MSLFVDTSVWPLALRRDNTERGPEVAAFTRTLERSEPLSITGLVLQELLQGFPGSRTRDQTIERLAALPLLVRDRLDHITRYRWLVGA